MKRSEFSTATGLTNRQIRWLTDNKRIPFTRLENGYFEFNVESIAPAQESTNLVMKFLYRLH